MTGQILWFATRGAGIVSLLLLTGVFTLGILTSVRWRAAEWPRFVTVGLHRNLALLAVVFLGVHIVSAILDPFVSIGWLAVLVPFTSSYRAVWVGLGSVAFDLILALVLTSLVRGRIGQLTWRLVHWSAYAAWPLAILHGYGAGSDAFALWMRAIDVACLLTIGTAIVWRVSVTGPRVLLVEARDGARAVAAQLSTVAAAERRAARRGTPSARGIEQGR